MISYHLAQPTPAPDDPANCLQRRGPGGSEYVGPTSAIVPQNDFPTILPNRSQRRTIRQSQNHFENPPPVIPVG
jgi:hypothetical protein